MATGIFTLDVVGVYTQDFRQVFTNARPMKASIKPDSKLMEHPVETGATISDHRILLPVEIELSMVLTGIFQYKNTYEQIRQLYRDATLLVVQTRVASYANQVIASIPHEESPDTYDAIVLALKLKEVQIVTSQFGTRVVPRNPNNSSTVGRGNQQSAEASAKNEDQGSVLYGLYK